MEATSTGGCSGSPPRTLETVAARLTASVVLPTPPFWLTTTWTLGMDQTSVRFPYRYFGSATAYEVDQPVPGKTCAGARRWARRFAWFGVAPFERSSTNHVFETWFWL